MSSATPPRRIAKRKKASLGSSSPGASKLSKDVLHVDEEDQAAFAKSKAQPFRNISNLHSPPPASRKARRTKSARDASPRGDAPSDKPRIVTISTDAAKSATSTKSTNDENADPTETTTKTTKTAMRKSGKGKKTVNIMSQPTEVITYTRDEPPQYQLESIITDRDPVMTGIRVSPTSSKHLSKKAQGIEEVVLKWDEEEEGAWGDGSALFSIHDLNIEMKVTGDTEDMTTTELKKALKERKLDTDGTRRELIARLDKAIKREMRKAKRQQSDEEEEEDDEVEERQAKKSDDADSDEEVAEAVKSKLKVSNVNAKSSNQKTRAASSTKKQQQRTSGKEETKTATAAQKPRVARRKGRLVKKGLGLVIEEASDSDQEE